MGNPVLDFLGEVGLDKYLHRKEIKFINSYWEKHAADLTEQIKLGTENLRGLAHYVFTQLVPEHFLGRRGEDSILALRVRDELFGKAVAYPITRSS